ncbi:hypothetical protein ABT084_16545 [Streptomyces sp. NPDC002138]|uniref:hypothetical protein n=1 Tax=Streptomyces sp. NPDC002138 TaxID=3154410 RepID=UPI00331FA7E7
MVPDAVDAPIAWKHRHAHRVDTVSAPYGPPARVGTLWPAEYTEGRIPAVPGRWREAEAEAALTVAEATPYGPASGLPGGGEPAFALQGAPHTLRAAVDEFDVAAGGRRLKSALATAI